MRILLILFLFGHVAFGQMSIQNPVTIEPSNRNLIVNQSLEIGDGSGLDSLVASNIGFIELFATNGQFGYYPALFGPGLYFFGTAKEGPSGSPYLQLDGLLLHPATSAWSVISGLVNNSSAATYGIITDTINTKVEAVQDVNLVGGDDVNINSGDDILISTSNVLGDGSFLQLQTDILGILMRTTGSISVDGDTVAYGFDLTS